MAQEIVPQWFRCRVTISSSRWSGLLWWEKNAAAREAGQRN
jgi:hypothetical protein